MSFFADNKSRPRLAVNGAMGQEPPLKRLRSVLGADHALGEVGYGVGTALGLARTGVDPAYGRAFPETSLVADARAWPLRAGSDEQLLAASGLSASLGSLGPFGTIGALGSLGLPGMLSTAAAFIERNLPKLDTSQVMPLKDLSLLQGNSFASLAGIQLPLPNARSKTKLCKHFIENNCKFKDLCNFAHSIDELKKLPGESDLEGKSLLERYKAKADAEKQMTGQDGMVELKAKLCKHFIDGECKFKEGCHFAHSIEELKRLPDDNDATGKALLERYKAKTLVADVIMNGESTQALAQTELQMPTSTIAKTKLCKHFISGNCKFKESCTFAHSIEELKSLPCERDDAGKALLEQYRTRIEVREPLQVDLKETGPFIKAELVEKTTVDVQIIPKLESLSNTATQVKADDKSVRLLKTKMCKHFLVGACKYSKNCTFAHAIEELKPPADAKDAVVKTIAATMPPQTTPVTAMPTQSTPGTLMPSLSKMTSSATGQQITQPVQSSQTTGSVTGQQVTQPVQSFQTTPGTSMPSLTKKTSSASQQITQPVQLSQEADGKQNEGSAQDKQGLLKTKSCRFFSEGTCRFGNSCAFLHNDQVLGISSNGGASQSGALQGPSEMKGTYKTRLCNMWEKDKTCSFGSKCHFAHGAEELRQRTGSSVPVSNSLMFGTLELEPFSCDRQMGLSSSAPYSYNITDTNWRPFRGMEETFVGLRGGMGVGNERMLDAGTVEALHLRSLLQNYGQVEQPSSLAPLSSLGGVNLGLTSNVFANLPSWPTR